MKYILILLIFNSVAKAQITNKNVNFNEVKASLKSFELFKKTVYKEPFENGVYIVNGDTPIENERDLKRFYYSMIAKMDTSLTRMEMNRLFEKGAIRTSKRSNISSLRWSPEERILQKGISGLASPHFIVDAPNGKISVWSKQNVHELKYCISTEFGRNYTKIKNSMMAASSAWMDTSIINFRHVDSLDDKCNENTNGVDFDIRPVDVDGEYLARAFFPRYSRTSSNVLIDKSALNLNPLGQLSIDGILRHELGHVLGLRHEHTRPESGACFEDYEWVSYGNYDRNSVMHYPQCNGNGDWSLTLSYMDKRGMGCLYGPPLGEKIDEQFCKNLVVN